MSALNRRLFLQTSLATAGAVFAGRSLFEGGLQAAPPSPLVWKHARATITGEERTSQPDIWCLEVFYKPVRMLNLDLPDPKTGQKTKQLVWYLCYRAVQRVETAPSPDEPKPADPPLLVPEIVLKTDTGKTYLDNVIPLAQAAINKRERFDYKNSVQIVGPIPPKVGPGVKDPASAFGCAMWRNIDPLTDKFTLFFNGFSNGYQIGKTPEGADIVLRKTLVVDFDRPSDELEQSEDEIRPSSDPRWEYLPTRDA